MLAILLAVVFGIVYEFKRKLNVRECLIAIGSLASPHTGFVDLVSLYRIRSPCSGGLRLSCDCRYGKGCDAESNAELSDCFHDRLV